MTIHNKRKIPMRIIIVFSLLLFILIITLILYECKCTGNMKEGFAIAEKIDTDTQYVSGTSTGPMDPPPNTNVAANKPNINRYAGSKKDDTTDMPGNDFEQLSKLGLADNEAVIFNQLRLNNLTDENINNMIDSGVITEQLIEKFLAYVDSMPPPEKMTFGDFIKEDK